MVVNHKGEATLSESNTSFSVGGFTIENRPLSKENAVNGPKRTTGEVLKGTIMEMREMSEVLRELGTLVGQLVSDKGSIA